jgi:hypothetical protein
MITETENRKEKQNNMKYKVFNVKDLLAEIKYEGVRKGTKTEAYLENVIESINKTKKYRWVQFFQLVDVFFVVVEILEIKEISNYINAEPTETKEIKVSQNKLESHEGELRSEPVKNDSVTFSKTPFPWKQ